jgi:hypothetical protein
VFGAIITIDTTVDLTTAEYFRNPNTPFAVSGIYPLVSPVSISAGDNVTMTVSFANGAALSIRSGGGDQILTGWLIQDFYLSVPGTSNYTISNASLILLDQYGSPVLSLSDSVQSDGNAQLGPTFQGAYIPLGETLTFSSYRATYVVDALQGQQFYAGPFLQFADLNGGLVSRVEAAPVPAPATFWLMFGGLGGLALARGRKAVTA